MKKQKSLSQVQTFVERVSAKQGWVPNPDLEFRRKIEEGLMTNFNRYGFFLCPCRDGDGDKEAERDITCPCEYNRADQAEYGHCYCGLFLSPQFAASGKKIEAIPERRPPELWED